MQTATTRPARRIPAARLARIRAAAAAQTEARELAYQAREDARHPAAEWEPAPRLTMLPGGAQWAGQGQVPQVGATVMVCRAGRAEPAQVKDYCHAAGFIGLVVEPQQPVKHTGRKPSLRANYVFAHQLAQAA